MLVAAIVYRNDHAVFRHIFEVENAVGFGDGAKITLDEFHDHFPNEDLTSADFVIKFERGHSQHS
ncbi:MAG: hypothetical protein AB7O04_03675 [Hyphomonadaceae bacterium]